MKNTIELYIDALFSVTNLDAYEKYNTNPKNELKDINLFKKQIYAGDIINLTQDEDGFTIIHIDEDGEKKKIKVLETIEEIQIMIDKISLLRNDESIFLFLQKKFDDLTQKTQKKLGKLKK